MNRLLASAVVSLVFAPAASGAIQIDVIDRGVPTDGTTTLDGFRGYTIRAISDDPITLVAMGLVPGFGDLNLYASGDLHQRWTDPAGTGSYTVTSPLDSAQNLVPDVMNFDSHALPIPAEATLFDLSETDPFFDERIDRSPLPSTPFVAYADPPEIPGPFFSFLGTRLRVTYELPAAANIRQIDIAYLVTNSTAGYGISVQSTTNSWSGGQTFSVPVPEPGGLLLPASLATSLLRREGL